MFGGFCSSTLMAIASTKKRRAFVLAYVLARQYSSCKLSAAKMKTPLNAMFCGAFRVNLLTSPTPQMSYLRS